MTWTPLERALDRQRFGGKAAQLARARREGLPVPRGFAVEADVLHVVANGTHSVAASVDVTAFAPETRFAVRSSAVDEDSESASFAGQHVTKLHVRPDAIDDALREVWASAHSESALAYRRRRGLPERATIAAVIQRMVSPIVSGVLFTRHPVTGAEERVIEASWGLGEAVVEGLVTPDSFRLDRSGQLIERRLGYKDLLIEANLDGGTVERELPPEQAEAWCLDEAQLAELHDLAARIERVFDGYHDVEWAFDQDGIHLLQRRSITA